MVFTAAAIGGAYHESEVKRAMVISGNAQRVLKIFHLLAVSFWIGGCLSEFILFYASTTAESGGELFGILRGSRFVSVYVVVYLGAFGSFFTGLAYSLCTNRGFFRHKWIIIKWVSTIYLMLCGTFFLGPWSTEMLEAAQSMGLGAIDDIVYIEARSKLLKLLTAHMSILIALTIISVYKPWEAKEAVRLLNKKLRLEK